MTRRIFEIDTEKVDSNFIRFAEDKKIPFIVPLIGGKNLLMVHGVKSRKDFHQFSREKLLELKVDYVVCCFPALILESFINENLSISDFLEDENGQAEIDEKLPEFIFGNFCKDVVWHQFYYWRTEKYDLYGFKGKEYYKAQLFVATTKKECDWN